MMTIRTWFERFAETTGERVETIAVGSGSTCSVDAPEVRDVLDLEFNEKWGQGESTPFVAWSPSFVLFVEEYDGFECIRWVPRSPTAHINTPCIEENGGGDVRLSIRFVPLADGDVRKVVPLAVQP